MVREVCGGGLWEEIVGSGPFKPVFGLSGAGPPALEYKELTRVAA